MCHRYNCALRQAESPGGVFEAAKKHNTGVVIMNASARYEILTEI